MLACEPEHGLELPHGVLVDDHLDVRARLEVDAAARAAQSRWVAARGEALSSDGVRLAWVWELDLYVEVFLPLTRGAVAIERALEKCGENEVELLGGDVATARLVEAAGARVVEHLPGPTSPAEAGRERHTRALAERIGVPSRLRRGSVLVLGYWHLVPLVDRMLRDKRSKPALALQAPVPGRTRSLRVAGRGGWLGLPGSGSRRRAAARAADVLAGVTAHDLAVLGHPLGELIHTGIRRLAAERAARDLAHVSLLRSAFRRSRPAAVVVPFDVGPEHRLTVAIAQELGINTVVVQHGAYLEQTVVNDLQVADSVAIWSDAARPALGGRRKGVHVVGYPGPVPERRPRAGSPYTITVLGQGIERWTSVIDGRLELRHYSAAVEAALAAVPDATIVLRPHPSQSHRAPERVQARFPAASIVIDTETDALELLARSHVCVGTFSTATLQAALTDTAVVVLNLVGREWGWPLGGDTPVPVARSTEELAEILRELSRDSEARPGREALLAALGATGDDSVERLLKLVEEAATSSGGSA